MKIGVFDSGLGGLTIVKTMLQKLHGADIVYIADTKNAPYGQKSIDQIIDFSFDITDYLLRNYKIDALVIACNTATSAAVTKLREKYEDLTIVGTEPGLKPAITSSKTKKVGVLATPATLNGQKYKDLVNKLSNEYHVKIYENACPGLVEQIEKGELDTPKTISMLENWLKDMKQDGVDTIVLGCTHYPLVGDSIKSVMGSDVKLVETSNAISKRVDELCEKCQKTGVENSLKILATGDISKAMVEMILGKKYDIEHISI